MFHTITIKADLIHRKLCSGCPCMHHAQEHARCFKDYWDSRDKPRLRMFYNWRTGEMRDPLDVDHALHTDEGEGWGLHTERPQKCIDELG